ncbi:carbon monoxide dehydrogenase [Metabacillus halosaccharovorans]|uniref:carbon monoxide dehydrogenase n=1 Tax=Metabacillus halosaccharovorans TaxID=930124 RepID=UPI0034CD0381
MKLDKRVYLLLFLLSILIFVTNNGAVYANTNETPPLCEEMYTQAGYKTVEEAVREFEDHFKKDVKLPFILPSIPFTHQFGRFTEDNEYNINDSLDIEFINEKSPENLYRIDIRPLKNKITTKYRRNQSIYTLNNGQEAIYIVGDHINFLIFEIDEWQYMLGINKKVTNKVTADALVEIANSID